MIQGRGLDYIVDLRVGSATFKQYKCMEFTIQAFAMDAGFKDEYSGVISYRDPEIGLHLPVEEIIISDYDRDACFLKDAFPPR